MPTCCDLDTTVGQVHWRFAEQTPVSQHDQRVTDSLRDVQPENMHNKCNKTDSERRKGIGIIIIFIPRKNEGRKKIRKVERGLKW